MKNKAEKVQCLLAWIKDRNIKPKKEDEKDRNSYDAFSSDSKLLQEKQNAA